MLVGPRPLEQHRPSGQRAGDQRSVERRIVGTVVAVAPGAWCMDHLHGVKIEVQRLGDARSQRIDALRMRPNGKPAALALRERRRRAERCVHLVRALKAGLQRRDGIGRRIDRRRNMPIESDAAHHRKAGARIADQPSEDVLSVEAPLGRPARRGRDPGGEPRCGPLIGVRNGEETAVTYQVPALEALVEARLEFHEARMVVRRPHHPRVQHAGQRHVVHEPARTGREPAKLARLDGPTKHPVRLRRLNRSARIDRDPERAAAGKLPPGRRAIAAGRSHNAIGHPKGVRIRAQALSGHRKQVPASRGSGEPHRLRRLLHRAAARGVAFIGRLPGLARDDPDAGGIDVELLGGHQRDRGRNTLADVDLAGAHRDATVGIESKPLVDAGVAREAGARDHQAARSRSTRATALSTAACVPQRQRCPLSAARTPATSGGVSRRRSASTATTSPGVQ